MIFNCWRFFGRVNGGKSSHKSCLKPQVIFVAKVSIFVWPNTFALVVSSSSEVCGLDPVLKDSERVTLDSAHIHSPAGGQGLNASFADAVSVPSSVSFSRSNPLLQFNLGWKLSLVLKEQARISLLDSYELERMPIISEMLQISTSLHNKVPQRSFAEGKGQGQALRDWQLFQLDVNYRHSPFVLDDRFADDHSDAYGEKVHDIRGGDRAPDAPGLVTLATATVLEPTRIFELFNPASHTVLISVPLLEEHETRALLQPVLKALRRLSPGLVHTALIVRGDAIAPPFSEIDFVLKDSEGHAFQYYGIVDGQLAIVVVRPDTYIGAFVNDFEGVEKYLSVIFGPSS